MNKKAAIGDSLLTMWHLVLTSFIVLVILGSLSVFYDYHIDVKKSEAEILGEKIYTCLAPEGVLDIEKIPQEYDKKILSYCKLQNNKRFFVSVEVIAENFDKKYTDGDSSDKWIVELFKSSSEEKLRDVDKYKPGYNAWLVFPVSVVHNKNKSQGYIRAEVLVKNEE